MKLSLSELPENIADHYKDKNIHKIEKKGSSTIIVYLRPQGKDTWRKLGKSWFFVMPVEKPTPTTLFGMVIDTPRIM